MRDVTEAKCVIFAFPAIEKDLRGRAKIRMHCVLCLIGLRDSYAYLVLASMYKIFYACIL